MNPQASSAAATTLVQSFARPTASTWEDFSRLAAPITNNAVLAAQRINTVAIALPAGLVVNSITFESGGTALAGGVHQLFGLYTVGEPPTRLAQTNDDGATAWAGNSLKTLALTAPFTIT